MDTRSGLFGAVTLAGLATLAACRSRDNANNAASADSAANPGAGPRSPARTGGMAGMPGMSGAPMGHMMGGGMMDSMRAHLTMIDRLSADRMKAMLPAHRAMVADMLSRMSSEMRWMDVSGDAAWTATVDSVRRDLDSMPAMSGPHLEAMMPAHRARITRLLRAHRDMMSKAKS